MNDELTVEPIAEVKSLDSNEFAAHFSCRRPVVVRGGVKNTRAFEYWNIDYLRQRAGAAPISMRVYGPDKADYVGSTLERTTFGAFLDLIASPDSKTVRYFFGDPSTIFLCNAERAELRTGFARTENPGFAALRSDFAAPQFIDASQFVYAALVVGTHANATGLHYDWGGEGKLLAQVRGRKRVVLYPPEQAFRLSLNALSMTEKKPHVAKVDIHKPDLARFPDLRDAKGYSAELEPGDAVYWPAFWLHDVTNREAANVAVAVALDEVRLHAPLMRHAMVLTLQAMGAALVRNLRTQGAPIVMDPTAIKRLALTLDGREVASMEELIRHTEQLLLSAELGDRVSLWTWNEALLASLVNSIFGRV